MAIIKQHDKRSGITYVYESKSYWILEKKMSRATVFCKPFLQKVAK